MYHVIQMRIIMNVQCVCHIQMWVWHWLYIKPNFISNLSGCTNLILWFRFLFFLIGSVGLHKKIFLCLKAKVGRIDWKEKKMIWKILGRSVGQWKNTVFKILISFACYWYVDGGMMVVVLWWYDGGSGMIWWW